MSRKLDEARKAYNDAARRNGRPELSEEQGPSVAPQSTTGDAPRDLIKNPYLQVNLDAQPQAISTPAPAAPAAAQSPAPASLASTAPASPKMSAAAREYAAAHEAAVARGADVSAMATPAPISEEPDAPPPPPTKSDLLEGGHVGTTQGDNIPDWKSRLKYQNFSNDMDTGVEGLRQDNPTLDIRKHHTEGGDIVISRKKLDPGQTSSSEPWSPMDPYGNVLHPIDYIKKFGLGAPKELALDVGDEAYNIGAGAVQNAAAVAGGLAGTVAGFIPGGVLGSMAASGLSGSALNAAKQAIGAQLGYGVASPTEWGATTAISTLLPGLLGTGVSKEAAARTIEQMVSAAKGGNPKALAYLDKILTDHVQFNIPKISGGDVARQLQTAIQELESKGVEAAGAPLAALQKYLARAEHLDPRVADLTKFTVDKQKGGLSRLWGMVSPSSGVASELIDWAKEKMPVAKVRQMAESVGGTIKDMSNITRRKLAEYLSGKDVNTPLVQAAEEASKDISKYMSRRYTEGLQGIQGTQNWASVLSRFEAFIAPKGGVMAPMSTDERTVYEAGMKLGANSLILRQAALESPLASPTQTLSKTLGNLKGLVNDPRVASGGLDFQDTITAFANRAADKLPHDAGGNHLVFWEDMLDDYQEFIRQWLPSPTRDHTTAEKRIYDVAAQLGDDYLLVHGPISYGPPAAKQFSKADRLFDALKNLKRGVTDTRRAAPGVMGAMARKIDAFVEAEKDRLYDLMPDASLKRDYKTSLEVKDKLASYFSDPMRAYQAMRQAELPNSKNGGFNNFIEQVDALVARAAGRDPNRVTFGDYAKNAAISNYFENKPVQATTTQSAGDLVRAATIQHQAPIVASRQIGKGLRSPATLHQVLKSQESPWYPPNVGRSLNLFNRLPEKVRPNRWQLLNTSTDALNKRDGGDK